MSLLQKLRSPKGFTLVELIIVIMIIGILAATLLPKVMGAPAKARDAGRQADLNALSTALEMHFADNEAYPIIAANDVVGVALVSDGYLKASLKDPVDSGAYIYVYCSASVRAVSGQAYAISTRLETSTAATETFTVGTSAIITPSANVTTAAVAAAAAGDYSAIACFEL